METQSEVLTQSSDSKFLPTAATYDCDTMIARYTTFMRQNNIPPSYTCYDSAGTSSESEPESSNDEPEPEKIVKANSPKVEKKLRVARRFTKAPKLSDEAMTRKTNPKKEKPMNYGVLQCSIRFCHMTFADRVDLKHHLDAHTDINRMFVCAICSLRFYSVITMFAHKQEEHSDIRRMRPVLTCTICQKFFSSKSKFNAHTSNHYDKSLPYLCSICLIRYKEKRQLTCHITREHPYSGVGSNCLSIA